MSDETYRIRAAEIISRYFGQTTGAMYKEYYQDKTREEIDLSLRSLLEDSLGPVLALQIFNDFKNSNYDL